MKDENKSKGKRVRRTNEEIDKDITTALKKIVGKVGFSNITLKAIAQESSVEPPVFYNKFGDLSGLLEVFVKKYEFWLNEIVDKHIGEFHKGNHEKFLSLLLKGIAKELFKDRVMQQLLIWEVLDINQITEKSAVIREANTRMFSKFYEEYFKDADINFNVFVSMLISGIYYLILHKDTSTFCTIDYNSPEAKEQLYKTIDKLCAMLFAELEPKKKEIEIAQKLKAKGVDNVIIAESTGLTIEQINTLSA